MDLTEPPPLVEDMQRVKEIGVEAGFPSSQCFHSDSRRREVRAMLQSQLSNVEYVLLLHVMINLCDSSPPCRRGGISRRGSGVGGAPRNSGSVYSRRADDFAGVFYVPYR